MFPVTTVHFFPIAVCVYILSCTIASQFTTYPFYFSWVYDLFPVCWLLQVMWLWIFCAHILVHVCLHFFSIYAKIVIKLLRDRVCMSSVLLDNVKLFSKDTVQVFTCISCLERLFLLHIRASPWHHHTFKFLLIWWMSNVINHI